MRRAVRTSASAPAARPAARGRNRSPWRDTLRRANRREVRGPRAACYARGSVVRPISFGTVTRDALPDQIAARLIDLITERRLKAGDRLPPERELAGSMGVSRSSLREALRALAMLGVAEMRHGDGTYLTSLSAEELMRPVGLVLALSDSGVAELFEARKLVEPGLAALAAERIDDEAAAEITRCARASADTLADAEAFMWNDIELHGLIARAAENAILSRLLES